MPYGFMGNACKTYLTKTNNAMSSAQAVSNRDPLAVCVGEHVHRLLQVQLIIKP